MKKNTKGITLITLVITVVVLLMIAGISYYSGKEIIQKAKLEELKTNMLLMQAKAREYVEEATFKMGIHPDENKIETVRAQVYGTDTEEGAQLEKAENIPAELGVEASSACYWLTPETQEKWGLTKIEMGENEKYLIQFNEENISVEIYNTEGYNGKYSLTEIDQIQQ